MARRPVLCRDRMRITANFPFGSPAPSGFFNQGIFDEADHRRDDTAHDAAARQLPGSKPPAPLAALPRAGISPERIEPPTPPPAAPAIVLPRGPRLIFFKRPPAAFPPTAPAISWIMKLAIVPDIFVSRLGPPDRRMPDPECRGLASSSNQLTGHEHIPLDAVC